MSDVALDLLALRLVEAALLDLELDVFVVFQERDGLAVLLQESLPVDLVEDPDGSSASTVGSFAVTIVSRYLSISRSDSDSLPSRSALSFMYPSLPSVHRRRTVPSSRPEHCLLDVAEAQLQQVHLGG